MEYSERLPTPLHPPAERTCCSQVDGALSQEAYLTALDSCYAGYRGKVSKKYQLQLTADSPAFLLFHCPYCKLVQKSVARLRYNDFMAGPEGDSALEAFRNVSHQDSLTDRDLEKAFVADTKDLFNEKTDVTLNCSRELGNTYTASLWFGLVSTICNVPDEDLVGQQLLCFSYGSGVAATMFSLHVERSVATMAQNLNLAERLDKCERRRVGPEVRPTAALESFLPTGLHGPTYAFVPT